MKTSNSLFHKVVKFMEVFLIVIFALLVFDVLFQVFARYVLKGSFTWTEELARFSLIWMSILGAAYLNCWDNAVAESFFKSLKVEWVYRHNYKLKSEAELSIFGWIETWYNNKRRHSFLGNKTIKEFEIDMNNNKLAA